MGNTNKTKVWRGFNRPMKVIYAEIALYDPTLGWIYGDGLWKTVIESPPKSAPNPYKR